VPSSAFLSRCALLEEFTGRREVRRKSYETSFLSSRLPVNSGSFPGFHPCPIGARGIRLCRFEACDLRRARAPSVRARGRPRPAGPALAVSLVYGARAAVPHRAPSLVAVPSLGGRLAGHRNRSWHRSKQRPCRFDDLRARAGVPSPTRTRRRYLGHGARVRTSVTNVASRAGTRCRSSSSFGTSAKTSSVATGSDAGFESD
jgi:hypothetical protein